MGVGMVHDFLILSLVPHVRGGFNFQKRKKETTKVCNTEIGFVIIKTMDNKFQASAAINCDFFIA